MASQMVSASRGFVVVHVADVPAISTISNTSVQSSYPLKRRRLFVLGGLLYLVGVLGYVVTTNLPSLKTSEPLIWGVCLPYAILMTKKLLKIIHTMEGTEEADDLENGNAECEDQAFGTHAIHDMIAVVGDVCVYVIGMLLFCYFVLPWQMYVE